MVRRERQKERRKGNNMTAYEKGGERMKRGGWR